MKIKHVKGSPFWHVVFGDVVIDGFYTRKEAKAFIEDNRELASTLEAL